MERVIHYSSEERAGHVVEFWGRIFGTNSSIDVAVLSCAGWEQFWGCAGSPGPARACGSCVGEDSRLSPWAALAECWDGHAGPFQLWRVRKGAPQATAWLPNCCLLVWDCSVAQTLWRDSGGCPWPLDNECCRGSTQRVKSGGKKPQKNPLFC